MGDVACIQKSCIRCQSTDVKPYGGRWQCLGCGFTFHRDSTDELDENIRREVGCLAHQEERKQRT